MTSMVDTTFSPACSINGLIAKLISDIPMSLLFKMSYLLATATFGAVV